MRITLAQAMDAMKACQEKAAEIEVPCTVTVVDAGGVTLAQCRMDGAFPGSVSISTRKAYTSSRLFAPTHALAEACKPGAPLYGMQHINDGEYIVFGGGYPVARDGVIVGGIGASGGTVEQDMEIAQAGLAVLQK